MAEVPSKDALAEQLAIAQLQQQIAEAKSAEAKAAKELKDLAAPPAPPAPAESEAEKKAKAAKAIAEAEKDAALARRAAAAGPTVTPPTGATTSTGASIENQVLAQRMLVETMKSFQQAFADKFNKTPAATAVSTLVLLNPADIPTLGLYASILEQLRLLQNSYTATNQEATDFLSASNGSTSTTATASPFAAFDPVLLGTAATGVVSSAASLLSLFRTTTDLTNAAVTVDDALLTATFAQVMQQHHPSWLLYAPAVLPVGLLHTSAGAGAGGNSSTLMNLLESLEQKHRDVQLTLQKLQAHLSLLQSQVAAPPPGTELPQLQENISRANGLISKLQGFGEALHQLQQSFVTTGGPLLSLVQAEGLVAKLTQSGTYLVALHATSTGSTRITTNLWRSGQIRFSAGAQLSYLVLKADGEIFLGGSTSAYTPYLKSAAVKQALGK